MGYQLPGVTISREPSAPIYTLSPLQRIPVIVGKVSEKLLVKNESVVRSSTGYEDELNYTSYGIDSIVVVESKPGLKDYKEGDDYNLVNNKIVWTSTGNIPVDGSTYYVTYFRKRGSDEYKFFLTYDLEDYYNKGGYPEDDKENVGIYVQIAFSVYQIPVIAVQPVKPPYSEVDYLNAINSLSNRDINTVLVLSSETDVRTALAKHVKERSLPTSKRERMGYTGAPSTASPSDICTYAKAISTEELVFVSLKRAKVNWYDPINKSTTETVIDGAGVAALTGLYRDSFTDPSFSLLRKRPGGFTLFEEDYDDFFVDDALIDFGEAGVLQIIPYKNQFDIPMYVDEITTDTSTPETSSISVIAAAHFNTKTIREALDDNFIGRKIIDKAIYADQVYNFLISVFVALRKIGSVASFSPSDIRVSVGTSFDGLEKNPQKVFVGYKYTPVYVNKQIEGYYSFTP